ncbi:MAG: NUDIX hydrolase [Synergistes sp.]|nr:NUDIX hydrolase [Synergistes sp.]
MKISKDKLRNIVDSQTKYKGHILDLRVDSVKFPSGDVKVREVIVHKPAVAMLPVDENGNIILIKQYRHAIDEEIFEIPAGLIDDGEDPRQAAERELMEEVGYCPKHIEEIAEFYSSPGYCDEVIYLYFADELTPKKLPEDDDEYIEVFLFTPEEIKKMIEQKEIIDSKTLMALYWYFAYKEKK